MTPLEEYKQAVASGRLQSDADQFQVMQALQTLFDQLVMLEQQQSNWFSRLKARLTGNEPDAPRGLYIWGTVGRGKTLMVDMFFHNLPFERKLRMHFHRFMQMIHHELREFEHMSDPLAIIADQLVERAHVICFDEFHVTDITDAMLLGNLFKGLFERGIVLVATSNTEPKYLYWDGLQRDRLLPAIELIEQYTRVMRIGGDTDHRLAFLDHADIYHWPLDETAEANMVENFLNLATEAGTHNEVIEIEGRDIPTVREADGVVWFEFEALCCGPRSAADYIEIARTYQTVVLSNVPKLTPDIEDQAKRFINLIDELYDRRVKLIISAAEAPDRLYGGTRHAADFQRTVSRLHEMSSHTYLAESHRP